MTSQDPSATGAPNVGTTDVGAANGIKPALAMLAVAGPRMPTPDVISAAARETFGETLPLRDGTQRDATVHFRCGEHLLFASLMPAPIPADELERPLATSWWWPRAVEAMADHSHHVVAGVIGENVDPVDARLHLTRLMTLLIDQTDAVGVYWGDGALLHDPPVFQRLTAGISVANPPTALWVNIQVGPDMQAADAGTPGLFAGYTLGLDALGHLEVQTRQAAVPGEQMFHTIHDFAHYLVGARPAIADGDTIGAAEHERIIVRYRANVWDASREAYELFFPRTDAPTERLS